MSDINNSIKVRLPLLTCPYCYHNIPLITFQPSYEHINITCSCLPSTIQLPLYDYLNKIEEKAQFEKPFFTVCCKYHETRFESYCFNCRLNLCSFCLSTVTHHDHHLIKIPKMNKSLQSYPNNIKALKDDLSQILTQSESFIEEKIAYCI